MKSQSELTAVNSNAISNYILNEVLEQGVLDYINKPLDAVDLVRIDNANMWMIKDTMDFSNMMLEELQIGSIELSDFAVEPPKSKVVSIEDRMSEVQKEVMADITAPLQNLFDDMLVYVTKELA